MPIEIREVTTPQQLRAFIRFPKSLYQGNPHYVPSLVMDELNTLRKDKNPAFEHCEAKYWLAYREGQIVGRVAAIHNRKHIEKWNQPYLRFGWLDFVDDPAVVDAYVNDPLVFHGKTHPSALGAREVEAFLTHLAVDRDVAAATQNQAQSALLFLFRDVLQLDLPRLDQVIAVKVHTACRWCRDRRRPGRCCTSSAERRLASWVCGDPRHFFHATEHLADAIATVHGDGTMATRHKFEALRERLLTEEDGAKSVINALSYLKRKHPTLKRVSQVLAYFRKNQRRQD